MPTTLHEVISALEADVREEEKGLRVAAGNPTREVKA